MTAVSLCAIIGPAIALDDTSKKYNLISQVIQIWNELNFLQYDLYQLDI